MFLQLSSSSDPGLGVVLTLSETEPGNMDMDIDYTAFANVGMDRFWINLGNTNTSVKSYNEIKVRFE